MKSAVCSAEAFVGTAESTVKVQLTVLSGKVIQVPSREQLRHGLQCLKIFTASHNVQALSGELSKWVIIQCPSGDTADTDWFLTSSR